MATGSKNCVGLTIVVFMAFDFYVLFLPVEGYPINSMGTGSWTLTYYYIFTKYLYKGA